MLLSRDWLKEFTDINAADHDFTEAMTMSGSKVEAYEDMRGKIKNVVVGRVLSMERHPDSDHMWVCMVDAGGDAPVQIVTGAQNVAAGDLVPAALHDSILPNGAHITRGKLRGVESNGMLCSLAELGLDRHDFPYAVEDGILILQESCAPGDDIGKLIGLDDTVVEFEITNNRPDCMSVIGLARESAATFAAPLRLHEPVVKGGGQSIAELLDVEVRDGDLCPRYTARMVKDVKIAPSPLWMRRRLRASGVRPINNIVDITNYVMLEYGQPMHAFDFACISGDKIIVRRAGADKTTSTLDGNVRNLTENMLVIADETRPVGIAGVMGGENSEITEATKAIVFESANFNGTSIRTTANALNLRTDASGRFEKGIDPMLTLPAVQRACELVELLGAGTVCDGLIDVISSDSAPTRITLKPAAINSLLGVELTGGEMKTLIAPLGFTFEGDDVIVPSWRGDVEMQADLAEEVARMYGYDKIPVSVFRGEALRGGFSEKQTFERELMSICRSMGLSEIITYSFVSPAGCDRIRLPQDSPLRNFIEILNPLGKDTSVMRTCALPSMMETLARNFSYRNKEAALFEVATVYSPAENGLANERKTLSLGAYGPGVDLFTAKGWVETVLREKNVPEVSFRAVTDDPSYHPGRCAAVFSGETRLGVVGQVHPLVEKNYDMSAGVCAAQLDAAELYFLSAGEKTYSPLPKYPSMARDIAVICGEDVTVAQLTDCIRRGGGKYLKAVELFDIYTGSHIQAGKKSVAFSLTLRDDESTLTDAHADEAVSAALALLEKELGAVLR